MTILVLDKIPGMGGTIMAKEPIHGHFQPYTTVGGVLEEKIAQKDTLYTRHLAIFLLNKYFVNTGESQHQHIPMPLGEVYASLGKEVVPIGMITEHVYGSEVSSTYNEHLDWTSVENAFKKFGFPNLDDDYYEGFDGSAHNHFKQDHLYPEEQRAIYQSKPGERSFGDRFSTSRWMRIDFEPGSFTFRKDEFTKAMNENQMSLQQHLSSDEYYFLSQYKRIANGEAPEDAEKLKQCVMKIRQANIDDVYKRQVDLARRDAAETAVTLKTHHPEYLSSFAGKLREMPSSLAELRKMMDATQYQSQDALDIPVKEAMLQLAKRYGDKLPTVKMFFSTPNKSGDADSGIAVSSHDDLSEHKPQKRSQP